MQAVLDAGYEEDMHISNTKIGARSASGQAGPALTTAVARRTGAADVRDGAAGAVLSEAVPGELLVARRVRGCVLLTEHSASGARLTQPALPSLGVPHVPAVQAFAHFKEKDFILCTRAKQARGEHAAPTVAWLTRPTLRARRSNTASRSLPGLASTQTSISSRCGRAGPGTPLRPSRCARRRDLSRRQLTARRLQTELRKSVTAWFYEDGELAQDVFKSDVLRLLATFERGRVKGE